MELQLVGGRLHPGVQRVALTLELLEFAYDTRENGESDDEAMDLHPLGQVPVLIADGETLFDAAAICEFLNELAGGTLLPEPLVERARARSWIAFADACLEELERTVAAGEERAFLHHRAELYYRLGRLEAELGDGPFWSGEPGLVDLTYAPLLMRLEHLARHTGIFDLSGFPKMEDWTYELMGHHAVRAVMPKGFDDAHLELVQKRGGYIASLVA